MSLHAFLASFAYAVYTAAALFARFDEQAIARPWSQWRDSAAIARPSPARLYTFVRSYDDDGLLFPRPSLLPSFLPSFLRGGEGNLGRALPACLPACLPPAKMGTKKESSGGGGAITMGSGVGGGRDGTRRAIALVQRAACAMQRAIDGFLKVLNLAATVTLYAVF